MRGATLRNITVMLRAQQVDRPRDHPQTVPQHPVSKRISRGHSPLSWSRQMKEKTKMMGGVGMVRLYCLHLYTILFTFTEKHKSTWFVICKTKRTPTVRKLLQVTNCWLLLSFPLISSPLFALLFPLLLFSYILSPVLSVQFLPFSLLYFCLFCYAMLCFLL